MRRNQRYMKIGTVANLEAENSNMTLVYEIDVFLINYS